MHDVGFHSLRLAIIGSLAAGLAFAAAPNQPVIEHAPVTVGVRGQPVVLRARVTSARAIRQVTLFYAVSRDAAPFKAAMNDSGSGWFTGTVPGDVTAGLKQLLYYIEARDVADATAETPWHTIELKGGQAPVENKTGAPVVTPVQPPAEPVQPAAGEGKSSWKKPALIAGGVLLVGGAALALSGGGGGGGDDSTGSSGGSATNTAGVYNGTATPCFQPPGGSSSCSSHAISITIGSDGTVTSDSLYEGTRLEGKLSGSNFLLVAPVKESDRTGEIQYLGTVVNNRIAGSIQGSATTSGGTGTYSGNFSAVK